MINPSEIPPYDTPAVLRCGSLFCSDLSAVLAGRHAGDLLKLPQKIVAVLIAALLCNAGNAQYRGGEQIDCLRNACGDDIMMEADLEAVAVDLPEVSGAEYVFFADRIRSECAAAVELIAHGEQNSRMGQFFLGCENRSRFCEL